MTVQNFSKHLILSTSVLGLGLFGASEGFAQTEHSVLWQDISQASTASKPLEVRATRRVPLLMRARMLQLDVTGLQAELRTAALEGSTASAVTLDLPLPGGRFQSFTVERSEIMSRELRQAFPGISTFRITSTEDPSQSGRVDLGPNGFHAVFSDAVGTIYVDPTGVSNRYQAYYKSDFEAAHAEDRPPLSCGADHEFDNMSQWKKPEQTLQEKIFTRQTELRTYRLAVAATAEYTQFQGGKPQAVAAIVTAVNRINDIYESELGIRFELVGNNGDIIFTDPDTDPFTNSDSRTMIDEVGPVIDNAIGQNNYDIGHVFTTDGGGIAQLNAVCGSGKANGVSGTRRPDNGPIFIDVLAHELGHQFGANHTFNGTSGSCQGSRSASHAYEPASGTTLMAYGGICAEENIQTPRQTHFHVHSLGQILEFTSNANRGGSCGRVSDLPNNTPVVTAGPDGTIPANTPFLLTGSATDADASDSLTYSWEQYDLGPATTSRADFVDDGQRPIFAAFAPVASPTRIFPRISDVLTGSTTYGEVLPTTDRALNFRLVARDNRGGIASAGRKLDVVAAAGPFNVTAPGAVNWAGNSTQTVTWDVAGTTAAPISCAEVEIALSDNGGQSFGAPLLTTANDGSADIVVPNAPTTTGRLRVKCATQPFFNVNSADFTITATATPNRSPVAAADAYTVQSNSGDTVLTVLTNDSDPDGDTLVLSAVRDISNGGTATIEGTVIRYRPAPNYVGTETFVYVVNDGKGGESSATVTVTVSPPPNRAPAAGDDAVTLSQGSANRRISVLGNDSDPDGDTLSLASVSAPTQGGTATIDGTAILYRPAASFSGTETFTYTVSDGKGGTATATVTATVTAAPPPPAPTPPPAANQSSGGGGGVSFGPFLLLLMAFGRTLRRRFGRRRRRS